MNRIATALALFLTLSAGVQAEELVTTAIPLPAPEKAPKAYPATIVGDPTGKVIYNDGSQTVSAAMCGIEGHGTAADLDAGLIDFNVPDPARAAGRSEDNPKDQGRNLYDYHSSVVLGVTLGYRF
jgi:hypothetical protein